MRAAAIDGYGIEHLSIRSLPDPQPGPDEVVVRVRAAALNHLDLFVLAGLPGVTIAPPWIMGGDGAGVVDAVGDAVSAVRPGDAVILNPGVSDRTCEYCEMGEHSLCVRYRLLGEHLPGTIAEYVVVPQQNVRVIPRESNRDEAAAYPLSTLTAWRMLVTRARLEPHDEVLIWGIGGGVALAALQIAKLVGARVWVTSGSDEKLARARALGADETINHRTTDVAKEVRARTNKKGVDVVVDSVGHETWPKSLGALGKRGRLVTCGGTSGPFVETDVRRLFWNQWSILGSTMGNDAEFDAITAEFRAGRLRPLVDSVWPLAESRSAFERMASAEQFGKIVIRIPQ
jgi:NADPH:quinone reductase-like Zn-dependent oxidoreductase